MGEILEVVGVSKSFGGVVALRNVSLKVDPGRVVGLIGPNGAGKTTLLNVISGLVKPDSGEVYVDGLPITGLPPHQVARRLVSRTFQIPRVFPSVTVLENLLIAASWTGEGLASLEARADRLLGLVGLDHAKNQLAGELSGGQQKLLELARALMSEPRVVLADEPLAGVHPEIKRRMVETISAMSREGRAFLLVSHDVPLVLELCDRVVVMSAGEKLVEGSPEEVIRDHRVVEAYLGS